MGNQHSRVSQEDEKTTHALTWMQPDRHGLAPSPRNGHTADMIEGKLYIFGGGDKAELLNELFVFDSHEHQWSQPPCTGIAPPPRSRHTSGVVDHRLLIWGGIGGGLDVHVLDTRTLAWSTPTAHGDVPESRFGHTSSTISPQDDARLLILGGHNSRAALSDVNVFLVEAMAWETPAVGGIAPVCGNRHAAVLLEDKASSKDGAVLVFAADMHDSFQTLYALRFTGELVMRWVELQTRGAAPVSRSRPCAVRLGQEVFLLCGVAAGSYTHYGGIHYGRTHCGDTDRGDTHLPHSLATCHVPLACRQAAQQRRHARHRRHAVVLSPDRWSASAPPHGLLRQPRRHRRLRLRRLRWQVLAARPSCPRVRDLVLPSVEGEPSRAEGGAHVHVCRQPPLRAGRRLRGPSPP